MRVLVHPGRAEGLIGRQHCHRAVQACSVARCQPNVAPPAIARCGARHDGASETERSGAIASVPRGSAPSNGTSTSAGGNSHVEVRSAVDVNRA